MSAFNSNLKNIKYKTIFCFAKRIILDERKPYNFLFLSLEIFTLVSLYSEKVETKKEKKKLLGERKQQRPMILISRDFADLKGCFKGHSYFSQYRLT